MAKKAEQLVTARLTITGPVVYRRTEVDKSKKKNKFRGPRETSQIHENIPIVMNIEESEYRKRIDAVTRILKTGEIPADEKTSEKLQKLVDLSVEQEKQIGKLKDELVEKDKTIKGLSHQLEVKKKEVSDLESKIPTINQADPVKNQKQQPDSQDK